MAIIRKFPLLLLFCIIVIPAYSQRDRNDSFNIGDSAPPLRVQCWIKGAPVQSFKKGSTYVLDFWATWCAPRLASMPYTSVIANKYRDKVTFVAISIWEKPSNGAPAESAAQIKAFVDSMGLRMNFPVAVDDSNFMANHWVKASDENGIPSDFVVNREGKVIWIGDPAELDTVLPRIIAHTWNIKEAKHKRISNPYLSRMDFETAISLSKKSYTLDDQEKAVSNISAIKKIVQKEPGLKYTPDVAYMTFWALLHINQQKVYAYGKKVIVTAYLSKSGLRIHY